MNFFRKKRRQKYLAEHPVPDKLWESAQRKLPLLNHLPPEEIKRLREMATIFLFEKEFLPLNKMKIREDMKLTIAMQATLPVLNLGLEWLDDVHTIYITPRGYTDLRRDAIGPVVHEYMDCLAGEVTEFGPIVFSWQDVSDSGKCSGYNVVIHEIAHKLDASNLAMDGCPFLGPDHDSLRWKEVFSTAFRLLEQNRSRRPPMDDYALESPAEFFAVACEEFFERPLRLVRHFKDVYGELAMFFKQDPVRGGIHRQNKTT